MRRISIDATAPEPEQVSAAIAAIRAGERVALPTETVYGLAADPEAPDSVARLRGDKGRGERHPFTHHLAEAAAIAKLAATPLPRRAERLIARYCPGPLTLVLPAIDGGAVGVRVPALRFTRAVLAEFPLGLFLTSVNRTGEPPRTTPDQIAASDLVDVLFDAGPPQLGSPSAVVRVTPTELDVLREGILSRDELLHTAAAKVLFVCSGNTCRSPLAEAIARRRVAERLGIDEADVLERGLSFASAGTRAGAGMPASENSVAVGAELGLDLREHVSHPLQLDDVAGADLVLCLGASHRDQIIAGSGRTDGVAMIDPADHEIADPFGGDVAIYRQTRDEIAQAVEARLDLFLALLD